MSAHHEVCCLQAAGAAFAVLFRGGGGSAVDSVIPSMLTALTGGGKGAGQALEGLRVILGVRPQTLGAMLPRLLRPPLTATGTRALAALAQVAGTTLAAPFVISSRAVNDFS